jgi:hypothetical protein
LAVALSGVSSVTITKIKSSISHNDWSRIQMGARETLSLWSHRKRCEKVQPPTALYRGILSSAPNMVLTVTSP